jgi:hypothetical protein
MAGRNALPENRNRSTENREVRSLDNVMPDRKILPENGNRLTENRRARSLDEVVRHRNALLENFNRSTENREARSFDDVMRHGNALPENSNRSTQNRNAVPQNSSQSTEKRKALPKGSQRPSTQAAGNVEGGLILSLSACADEPSDGLNGSEAVASGYALCEHIKGSGERCGSPAVRDRKFCYYHGRLRRLVPKTNLLLLDYQYHKPGDPYFDCDFPTLEDAESIQIGFMQVIHGVAQGRLSTWQTKALLSALHGAAANLRQLDSAMTQYERGEAAKQQRERAEGETAPKR